MPAADGNVARAVLAAEHKVGPAIADAGNVVVAPLDVAGLAGAQPDAGADGIRPHCQRATAIKRVGHAQINVAIGEEGEVVAAHRHHIHDIGEAGAVAHGQRVSPRGGAEAERGVAGMVTDQDLRPAIRDAADFDGGQVDIARRIRAEAHRGAGADGGDVERARAAQRVAGIQLDIAIGHDAEIVALHVGRAVHGDDARARQ